MLITRRQVLAGCMAVGAEAMGRPVRSLVGANQHRMYEEDNGSVSAADYVQNGLVAMYDGIENAGLGVHDPDAASWTDLVGGFTAADSGFGGVFSFGDDEAVCEMAAGSTAGSGVLMANLGASANSVRQMEAVYHTDADNTLHALCLCGATNRQFLVANVAGANPCQVGYSLYAESGVTSTEPHCYSVSLTGGWPISSAYYCDGGLLPMSMHHTLVTQYQTYSDGRLFIGYRSWEIGSCHIKSIRLYSRNLSAREVSYNYAIDKRRFGI